MSIFVIVNVMLLILIVTLVVYFVMNSKKALTDLQNKIMYLINGKMSFTNLKVTGSLNILGSNASDNYPLKLLSSSTNKNVITFSWYGVTYNELGIVSSSLPSLVPTTTLLTANIQPPADLSVSSLRQQINDIISGKTQLNYLYVTNKLTILGPGLATANNGIYSLNGGLSIINKSGDTSLDSLILFQGNTGKGQLGVSKTYASSGKLVFDRYSSNVNYTEESWAAGSPRSICPSSTPSPSSTPTPTSSPQVGNATIQSFIDYVYNATSIQSLQKQFDDILNGTTPINNLVVNGYVIVDSTLDSPLTIDTQSCDTTSLIGFNNVDATGVNALGGVFNWFDNATANTPSYFDPTVSYSGNLITTML